MITDNCGNCDNAINAINAVEGLEVQYYDIVNAINGRLCLLIRKYRGQNAICEKYQAKNNNN